MQALHQRLPCWLPALLSRFSKALRPYKNESTFSNVSYGAQAGFRVLTKALQSTIEIIAKLLKIMNAEPKPIS